MAAQSKLSWPKTGHELNSTGRTRARRAIVPDLAPYPHWLAHLSTHWLAGGEPPISSDQIARRPGCFRWCHKRAAMRREKTKTWQDSCCFELGARQSSRQSIGRPAGKFILSWSVARDRHTRSPSSFLTLNRLRFLFVLAPSHVIRCQKVASHVHWSSFLYVPGRRLTLVWVAARIYFHQTDFWPLAVLGPPCRQILVGVSLISCNSWACQLSVSGLVAVGRF